MSAEGEMTINERHKYLRKMKKRYVGAGRKQRGRGELLTEMAAVTGLHRKNLIRLMNGSLERKARKRERGATYGPDVDRAIQVIAESLDYPCAARLTPNLVTMAQHLAQHGELRVSERLLEQLGRISVSTVERRLARFARDRPRPPRPTTSPAAAKEQKLPALLSGAQRQPAVPAEGLKRSWRQTGPVLRTTGPVWYTGSRG